MNNEEDLFKSIDIDNINEYMDIPLTDDDYTLLNILDKIEKEDKESKEENSNNYKEEVEEEEEEENDDDTIYNDKKNSIYDLIAKIISLMKITDLSKLLWILKQMGIFKDDKYLDKIYNMLEILKSCGYSLQNYEEWCKSYFEYYKKRLGRTKIDNISLLKCVEGFFNYSKIFKKTKKTEVSKKNGLLNRLNGFFREKNKDIRPKVKTQQKEKFSILKKAANTITGRKKAETKTQNEFKSKRNEHFKSSKKTEEEKQNLTEEKKMSTIDMLNNYSHGDKISNDLNNRISDIVKETKEQHLENNSNKHNNKGEKEHQTLAGMINHFDMNSSNKDIFKAISNKMKEMAGKSTNTNKKKKKKKHHKGRDEMENRENVLFTAQNEQKNYNTSYSYERKTDFTKNTISGNVSHLKEIDTNSKNHSNTTGLNSIGNKGRDVQTRSL